MDEKLIDVPADSPVALPTPSWIETPIGEGGLDESLGWKVESQRAAQLVWRRPFARIAIAVGERACGAGAQYEYLAQDREWWRAHGPPSPLALTPLVTYYGAHMHQHRHRPPLP